MIEPTETINGRKVEQLIATADGVYIGTLEGQEQGAYHWDAATGRLREAFGRGLLPVEHGLNMAMPDGEAPAA